jgi:hypothetical protein
MKRRKSLALLAASAPCALALSCAPAKPPDRRVRVPRERLRAEGHFGCRVQWEAKTGSYHCPCHDARFDGEGRPVSGPALRPLRSLRVEIAGGDLLVGDP